MVGENKVPVGFLGITRNEEEEEKWREEKTSDERLHPDGMEEVAASSPTHLFALDVEGGA